MPTSSIEALLICLCLSVASFVSAAPQMPGNDEVLIASALVAESQTPAPGTHTTLAIVMEPQDEWHGYWKQPGDVGFPPKLSWRLPEGVSVGEAEYPVPQTLLIDGLMNHVYEHPYALLVPLQVPAGMPVGSQLPIQLDMQYLACRYDACVPERASLNTRLTVGDGTSDAAVQQRFAQWRQALPRPLGSKASFSVDKGIFRLMVPLPAAMAIKQPHLFSASKGAINNAAEQRFERKGDVLVVETEAGDKPADFFSATLSLGDGLGLDLQAGPAAVQAAGGSTLSVTLVALAGAVLGGLLLNLMPCVFPILSLKALSIARSSSNAASARSEAVAYSLGVIMVCLLLGGILLALRAGGAQVGWAFQLQDPRVIFVLLLLSCAIAFNLTGLFELSSVSSGSGLTERKGAGGAFWTGALAAFVATPCTGPFMAAALGAALVLPPAAALLVFAGLGLGIALPFLLLGFIPALQRCLPKPGSWMQTLRNILAVPMFLTALALLWVLSQQVTASALVAVIGCSMLFAFGLWITGLRQRVFKKAAWMPAVLAALLAFGLGLSQTHQQPEPTPNGDQLAFDQAKLSSLRKADKPVFLYFTADWCVTCKVNEQVAIDRDETHEAFAKAGVVSMRGDWTDGDSEITAFLEQHGRSGVPFYLWYTPGKSEPTVLPQVLTPSVFVEQLAN
ncbi:protein-disulfide reductase DsbD family protein [Pseudomonas sp. sp1636]|uniref:protein-disulfide reductase DsbD family protein n=1 Tax=Pseudomonas sp. sp1636 TaxID=3036707 RepID=UPI0025A62975|nr:thioredoxin family protein [Pseudomonas sp. sp1636]MDM8350975.1 protein-disulfide reductase DsbD family protein [Pseudomonas sp. sp1636]